MRAVYRKTYDFPARADVEKVRILPSAYWSFRAILAPDGQFRGNVWESGTQYTRRKTFEFPGLAAVPLIGPFVACPGKGLRLRESGRCDDQICLSPGKGCDTSNYRA